MTVVPPGATTQLALTDVRWYGAGTVPPKESGISLIAPEIDATYATLTERGVRFKEPISVMPWGQKATWFYDLDGNEYFLATE